MKKFFLVIITAFLCCHVSASHRATLADVDGMSAAALAHGISHSVSPADADAICGTYLVISPKNKEDKIRVRIYRTENGTYAGRITWLQPCHNPDGTERTDLLNKDPKLRGRKVIDIILCWNLKYDAEDNMWKGGMIYDPTTGKTFGIQLKIAKNGKDIEARYYKGRPAFGINQRWIKFNK